MYIFFKKILLNLPFKKFIYQNEFNIRWLIYYIFYRGENYYCNLCDKKIKSFIFQKSSKDYICPCCGSLSRNRVFWDYFSTKFYPTIQKTSSILHFSPHRYVRKTLKKLPNIQYTDSDFLSDSCIKRYDICSIHEPNETYDIIICYHVLEHIKNDMQAIKELYRVLKNEGVVFIQVPWGKEFIEEPPEEEKSPQERLKLFGQEDHVRIYTLVKLKERLISEGFIVEEINHAKNNDHAEYFGWNKEDTFLLCKKNIAL